MRGYDNWKTSPPEDKVYCECEYCGNDIYEGTQYVKTGNGEKVHEECFKDFAWEQLDASHEEADTDAEREAYEEERAEARRVENMLNGRGDWF